MAEGNAVGWFEIPVKDMERAIAFYEAMLQVKLERHAMGPLDMAWFPRMEGKGAAGSLVRHEQYKPSEEGALVYFTAYSGDVDVELERASKAGGKVLFPKKPIGEHGFVAVLLDTEGNRIALHSRT